MAYYDIVAFDFEDYAEHGFDKIYRLSKEIFEYSRFTVKPQRPAILATTDKELARRAVKVFDLIRVKNYEISPALLRAVAQKRKLFLISIGDILERSGEQRATIIHRISRFVKACRFYKAFFVLASMAKNIYEVRSRYEIEVLGEVLGLTREQARFALTTLEWLNESNSERKLQMDFAKNNF